MNLLIYHPWIFLKGGGERVVLEMADHLSSRHKVTIATHVFDPKNTFPGFGAHTVLNLSENSVGKDILKRGFFFSYRIMSTKLKFFRKIDMSRFDLTVVSTGGIGELITLRNHDVPVIAYCHTPLRALHDPVVRRHYLSTNYRTPLKKILFIIASSVYGILEKKAWTHFDHVIFNSENTRKRALTSRLISKRKTRVAYPGTDLALFKPGRFDRYFFLPGRISPSKRIELGIAAFRKAKIEGFRLVIAGHVAKKDEGYLKMIRKLSGEGVEIIISPEDKQMISLYRNCYSALFTAMNEDFGMVPVEAQACGKPVIAVDEGGPKESVIHGVTGFLVRPHPDAFAKAMKSLAEDPGLVREMGRRARENSKRFSWDAFNRSIDEVLRAYG